MSEPGVAERGSAEQRFPRLLAPRGWPDFFFQVALLGSFELVYALSGIYGRDRARVAVGNGRDVMHLEGLLGLSWEHGIQDWALAAPRVALEVANRMYFISQFWVSTVFLLWVYVRRTERFGVVRNALLAANAVSVLILFAYPTAPPRLVPGAGFVDTLNANAVNLHSSLIDALNNPYSAMPSLHASYAIVIGVAGVALSRSVWARCAWMLYPLVVAYSVIATGNHFVLDIVVGVAAPLGFLLVGRVEAAIARQRSRGSVGSVEGVGSSS